MARGLTSGQDGQLEIKNSRPRALLILEDGTVYKGRAFGVEDSLSFGELVFNTSLTGYQEILTDPSYAGQIVTLTYPEIGNYGVNEEDIESRKIFARGLVVRNLSKKVSNWRATSCLDSYLKKAGISAISDVDTRAITRHIRDNGAMRCMITSRAAHTEGFDAKKQAELVAQVKASPEMEGLDLTGEVSCEKPYTLGNGRLKVAVIDYGIKLNILRSLTARDITATVYPARTPAKEILESRPDGIFLSNGPGDPAACSDILSDLPHLIQSRIPIFGICLGHQLLSIAMGAKTYKLKFGHRGGNHPVKDMTTGKIEITSQNHGFAVDEKSMPNHLELTHINLNDLSVEGFRHKELPIFAVQYHPEASPGPHDSSYLFDRFASLIESHQQVGKGK
ncbi:MAG: glutamine-hydrolyzing carbamoyl-phosphate synthase small subunit [Cyanobacteria bacterium SZAS LIN-2]|nr:glutamine-hydrolyzing carbamoyl-phosphate synthase small subunit [Cyanobacteria bacterium SZAS LIN-2]